MITFTAEIREVKARKLISLDQEVSVKLTTNELSALELAKIPTDKVVEVTIEPQ